MNITLRPDQYANVVDKLPRPNAVGQMIDIRPDKGDLISPMDTHRFLSPSSHPIVRFVAEAMIDSEGERYLGWVVVGKSFICRPEWRIPERPAVGPMPVGGSRADHLAWCKQRALEYVAQGDMTKAYASMVSDLKKHDETRDHVAIEMGAMLMFSGHLDSAPAMRGFILGFN